MIKGVSTFDIQMHDTYFVFDNYHIILYCLFFLVFFAVLYFYFEIYMIKWMTITHSFLTVSLLLFISSQFLFDQVLITKTEYLFSYFQSFLAAFIILTFCSQLLFIFNLIYGIVNSIKE